MKRENRKKNKVIGFLKILFLFLIALIGALIYWEYFFENVEINAPEKNLNLDTDYYDQQAYVLDSYEVSKYFEIPLFDGWTATKIDNKEIECDEVILLTKNSISLIIFLEDYHVENGDISQIGDNLFEELNNKYPNYSFKKNDKLNKNIVIVNVDYNNSEDYMHIIVAKINGKLITLSYSYKMCDIFEAELYLVSLTGKVNQAVKGV